MGVPSSREKPTADIRRTVSKQREGGVRKLIASWPLVRQLTGPDRLGLGSASRSARSTTLVARTATADAVVPSICPYCAVGCGQKVYVTDGSVTQIEGDPDSPISLGKLCPKGSASHQLVTNPGRITKVRYRRPHGTEWEASTSTGPWT